MNWKSIALVGVLGSVGCMDMDMNFDQGVKGSGKVTTENRSVGKFSKINMKGAYDVEVNVGPDTSLKITGDDNLLKLVETNVVDGALVLSTTKNVHPSKKGLKISITTPNLDAFSLKGAGDVNIDGIKGNSFTANLFGAGDLTAKGNVDNLDATLKGAGDLKLYDLHAANVNAQLSGAGDMNVWASKYLNAKMSGVGDLSYKGHPAKVDKDKSGVGNISAQD
jgi:hypothetical protein